MFHSVKVWTFKFSFSQNTSGPLFYYCFQMFLSTNHNPRQCFFPPQSLVMIPTTPPITQEFFWEIKLASFFAWHSQALDKKMERKEKKMSLSSLALSVTYIFWISVNG